MASLRVPHESAIQAAVWTAWPVHEDWAENKPAAQRELAALTAAIAGRAVPGAHVRAARAPAAGAATPRDAGLAGAEGAEARAAGEGSARARGMAAAPPASLAPLRCTVLAPQGGEGEAAAEALGETARVAHLSYGDIWLRDTGPVIAHGADGRRAVGFRFNGWGGKYLYPADVDLAERVARAAGLPFAHVDLVAEGGGLEFDGEGTALTTKQCLLNPNRNPSLSARDVEGLLAPALGVERVIWLEEGLAGDHTDGHIDNIARIIRPGLVLCQAPAGPDDPNAKTLDAIARALDRAQDAAGRRLDVARIPSPGLVADENGKPRAASHMNFVHAPGRLVVPVYDTAGTAGALDGLAALFPDREIVALSASALLTGGGGFHCVTCNIPL